MSLIRRLATLAALGLLPVVAGAAGGLHEPFSVTCEATRDFHDGDTFRCVRAVTERAVFVVRVAGDDAPETGQAFWRVSRDRLRLVAGPGTVVGCYKTGRYGREVCRVTSPSGADVVEAMVMEGLAWHSVQFAREQSLDEQNRYAAAEQSARAAGAGLWSVAGPQPLGTAGAGGAPVSGAASG